MSAIADEALAYGRLGWKVLPLWSVTWPDPLEAPLCTCPRGRECTSPGKHPRLAHGVLEASAVEATILDWWTRWPDANVGVATGSASGIYVIDLDGPRAVEAWKEMLERIPAGWTSRTGSGVHHVYSLSGSMLPNSAGKLGAGIDTRGENGYIVAPPSVHYRALTRYQWLERAGDAPPPLPSLLRSELTPRLATPPQQANITFGDSTSYAMGVLKGAVGRIRQAGEGKRNSTLNDEAFLIGQWVAGGELNPIGVAEVLEQASTDPDRGKVRSTVRRALVDGAQYPRTKADDDGPS
jgi:hypothetical protein